MLHQAIENAFTILPHPRLSNIDCIFIGILCYTKEEIDTALGEIITIFATVKVGAWNTVYHARPILKGYLHSTSRITIHQKQVYILPSCSHDQPPMYVCILPDFPMHGYYISENTKNGVFTRTEELHHTKIANTNHASPIFSYPCM